MLALSILLLLTGCTLFLPNVAPGRKFRTVGYVRARTDIAAIGAKKLTHINYAFAKVSPEGEIVFDDPDAAAHLAQLQALKAKNPHLKILVSVGGWGADNFSDAALTEESRAKFAQSALAMIRRYALDGIDLDWEYPGQAGPGIKFRAEDKENFTLMLKAIRDAIGPHRLLTIASSAGPYFQHTEMEKLHVDLDFINIMTYDFTGSWTKTTGHHTGLYPLTESFVLQHLAAGIPSRKLNVGVAFYGRSWEGVTAENDGLGQPYGKYYLDLSYARIESEFLPSFEKHWDSKAKASFLWSPSSQVFVTYDDPRSLREKAKFIRRHRLGGAMYWEHSHDPKETLLDVLFRYLR